MAEIAILAGAGWVLSPVIYRLINEAWSDLGTDVAHRLGDLEAFIVPQLELVIEAAERRGHMRKFERWLQQVNAAIYDAEDMLDEPQYQLMEQRVRLQRRSTVRLLRHPIPQFIYNTGDRLRGYLALFSGKNRNLNRSLNRLRDIAEEGKKLCELLNLAGPTTRRITTNYTSQDPPDRVFGRGQDCKCIEDLLTEPVADDSIGSSTAPCYSVIAIVGVGGVGKTTVAQKVYAEINSNHSGPDGFDIRMWISVSHSFDALQITRKMAEKVSQDSYSHEDDIHKLRDVVKNKLKFQKFLVVLDDVWSDEGENITDQWNELLSPLLVGKKGSKILLTTRAERTAQDAGATEIYELKDLETQDMFLLLTYHAFSRFNIGITQLLMQELKEIGWQIAEKLKGSPLLAKVVGIQLSKKLDASKWSSVLEGNMLESAMQTLLWSYQRLPPHLQRCFSYCSLFPHGHRFQRDELVRLWMAQGFIEPPKDESRIIEEVGEDYFDNLVSYSFFQPLVDGNYSKSYILHDLLHDLADEVAKDDCFRVEGDGQTLKIPASVHHLSISNSNLSMYIKEILKLTKLRTLIFTCGSYIASNDLNEMLKKFKKLRILHLSGCYVEKLPESIGHLKHLRCLNLSETGLKQLPLSLGRLFYLMFLNLSSCQLNSLPEGLNNLINLRCLEVEDRLLSSIPEIGRLTALQKLKEFHIRMARGHELRQLREMRMLRGSLRIVHLENVEGRDEASQARLKDKRHVDSLSLEWNHPENKSHSSTLDAEVLKGLEPPQNLKDLHITGYRGSTYPSWMVDSRRRPSRLASLELTQCDCLEDLLNIGQLFPSLRSLVLKQLVRLRRLPNLPSSLEEVVIEGCPWLVFASKEELQGSVHLKWDLQKAVRTSHLKTIVRNVPFLKTAYEELEREEFASFKYTDHLKNMQQLGPFVRLNKLVRTINDQGNQLERLVSLQWLKMELTRMELFSEMQDDEVLLKLPSSLRHLSLSSSDFTGTTLSVWLQKLTALSHLTLCNNIPLTSFPSEEELSCLTALEVLKIERCWLLTSLGGLLALASLKELEIDTCPCLMDTKLPPSLLSLRIRWDMNLLPGCLNGLSSLTSLKIESCPSLEFLVLDHLQSLTHLSIKHCPELRSLWISRAPNSLKALLVKGCPKLASAPSSAVAAVGLSSLHELTIDDPSLLSQLLTERGRASLKELMIESFGGPSFTVAQEVTFQQLSSLQKLSFSSCDITSLPDNLMHLSSLEILSLEKCSSIISLPDYLKDLSSLKILSLEECSNIRSLPDLPHSLVRLSLHHCNPSMREQLRNEGSVLRGRISHIHTSLRW